MHGTMSLKSILLTCSAHSCTQLGVHFFPLTFKAFHCRNWVLTQWSRLLRESLIVVQLVKKFPAFYWTRKVLTLPRFVSIPSQVSIVDGPPPSNFCKIHFNIIFLPTSRWVGGCAVGWGTAIQAGRSRVRFPILSLEFFIDTVLPAALWPWGWLSSSQKLVRGIFPGGKGGRFVELTT